MTQNGNSITIDLRKEVNGIYFVQIKDRMW